MFPTEAFVIKISVAVRQSRRPVASVGPITLAEPATALKELRFPCPSTKSKSLFG